MRIRVNRILLLILVVGLIMLNYQIWFAEMGISKYFEYRQLVSSQQKHNNALVEKNTYRLDQVNALKFNHGVVEQAARSDLGMIAPGERFFQFS